MDNKAPQTSQKTKYLTSQEGILVTHAPDKELISQYRKHSKILGNKDQKPGKKKKEERRHGQTIHKTRCRSPSNT